MKAFVRFKAYTRISDLSIVHGIITNVMIVFQSFKQNFYEEMTHKMFNCEKEDKNRVYKIYLNFTHLYLYRGTVL